jgi:hypothetical protein
MLHVEIFPSLASRGSGHGRACCWLERNESACRRVEKNRRQLADCLKAGHIRLNLTNFGQCGVCMEPRKPSSRLSKVVALALIVEATGSTSVSLARAASDCSISTTLVDWGESSSSDIDVVSGQSCLFPIRMHGTVSSSDILQKPVHGKLKKLNLTTYEYKAKARYRGSDSFSIKATGLGPTASGTSEIIVHATVK